MKICRLKVNISWGGLKLGKKLIIKRSVSRTEAPDFQNKVFKILFFAINEAIFKI